MTPHFWTPRGASAEAVQRTASIVAQYLARAGAKTPALLMDRAVVRSQAKCWLKSLPTVAPYYAVKANIDPLVLRELFSLGVNADVASAFEIRMCRAVGLSGRRMIVSNPRKDRDTIRAMRKAGAFATVVDSEEEVDKLAAEGIPRSEYHPVVFVRIKVPTKGVVQDLSSKFGVRVLRKDIDPLDRPLPAPEIAAVIAILRHAKAAGFQRLGLSTHAGTQCANPAVYATALEVLEAVARRLVSEELTIGWIDLGGGFADKSILAAHNTNAELLGRVGLAVQQWSGPPVQFLAEPGRFFVADGATLLSRVNYDQDTEATGRRVQIDDGIYRTFSGRVHDEKNYQFAALRLGGAPFAQSVAKMVVWGCSCDSFDKVADAMILPADLKVGDYVLADTMGAYSTSFGSNTNGFQPAPVVLFAEAAGAVKFTVSPMADQNDLLLGYIRKWLSNPTSETRHE